MANQAQCFYCFECISASFDDREPPSLEAIEGLWEQYEQVRKLAVIENKGGAFVPFREGNERNRQDVREDDEKDSPNGDIDGHSAVRNARPRDLKLPSISRLQSQMSLEPSSAVTTPSSSTSNNSSNSSNSTTVTTPNITSPPPEVSALGRSRPKTRQHPLFVTWDTLKKNKKSLRGCIGTFEAQELSDGLRNYALISAFQDTRFSPIPESLLPSLACSLTLLGSFEPCTDAMDWVLGTHGLRISFIHRGRRYGATYLPDVAVEQGWTKEETVESLMRKAGWHGSSGGVTRRLLRGSISSNDSNTGKPWEQVSEFRAVRYQGLRASATYAEWQDWRNWVLSLGDGGGEKLLYP